jgi:uncharacterized membrane protein SirB2
MDYLIVKQVHVACAALSWLGFFARGVGMMRGAAFVRGRWAKTLPHAVDTVLLASAFVLAWMLRQVPFVHGWLTAKLIALIAYIGLGMVALHWGRTKRLRLAAWIAAQAVFGYIVAVAVTRNPLVLG